eukprot:TRINITY_DN54646_c0_g1_i1.p1 TRINITY_DN54646_c0_g1~~TRINITY_DN54646_c0_g1_i1.p1  ORF type:complete len:648 (-),score=116.55 TRINITY_DN54646_c0_g1_i1:536-2479(-)
MPQLQLQLETQAETQVAQDQSVVDKEDAFSRVYAISSEILQLHELLLEEHEHVVKRLSTSPGWNGLGLLAEEETPPPADITDLFEDTNGTHDDEEKCAPAEETAEAMRIKSLRRTGSGLLAYEEELAKEDAMRASMTMRGNSFLDERAMSKESGSIYVPGCPQFVGHTLWATRRSWRKVRQRIRDMTETFAFEIFFGAMILSNSVAMGVELNQMMMNPMSGPSYSFVVLNYLYTLLFLFELVCRILAQGPGFFWNTQWCWNLFDFLIVMASLVELVSDLFGMDSVGSGMGGRGARLVRLVRVTRLIRIFRVARLIRFIRALRQLVHSIFSTLKEVIWAFVLILLLIYVFAIVFVQFVSSKVVEDGRAPTGKLYEYWGSLPRAMWALFLSISNGVSWDEVVEPLKEVWAPLIGLFAFYVTFTVFAMLNVITGVFCESAIASARTDADMATQEHMLHKTAYMNRVKQLFNIIDHDGKSVITYDELAKYLSDEQAAGFFAALDIDISDVWTLFKLLDEKESRIIDIDEFVGGCCRLKGEARSIDVALMSYEHKLFRRRVFKVLDEIETSLIKLQELQEKTASSMTAAAADSANRRLTRSMSCDSQSPRLTKRVKWGSNGHINYKVAEEEKTIDHCKHQPGRQGRATDIVL